MFNLNILEMEKGIKFLGNCFSEVRILINPFSYKPLMLICYLSIGFISLFIAAGYARSKMLFKKAGYGFKFKR